MLSIPTCFSCFPRTARPIVRSSSASVAPRRISSRKDTSLASNKQTWKSITSIAVAHDCHTAAYLNLSICSNTKPITSCTEMVRHAADKAKITLVSRDRPGSGGIIQLFWRPYNTWVVAGDTRQKFGRGNHFCFVPLVTCRTAFTLTFTKDCIKRTGKGHKFDKANGQRPFLGQCNKV